MPKAKPCKSPPPPLNLPLRGLPMCALNAAIILCLGSESWIRGAPSWQGEHGQKGLCGWSSWCTKDKQTECKKKKKEIINGPTYFQRIYPCGVINEIVTSILFFFLTWMNCKSKNVKTWQQICCWTPVKAQALTVRLKVWGECLENVFF